MRTLGKGCTPPHRRQVPRRAPNMIDALIMSSASHPDSRIRYSPVSRNIGKGFRECLDILSLTWQNSIVRSTLTLLVLQRQICTTQRTRTRSRSRYPHLRLPLRSTVAPWSCNLFTYAPFCTYSPLARCFPLTYVDHSTCI